jgi:pantothenate kinase
VEGLYLFLQLPVWESICEMFDERWFIDCSLDIAMRRVEVRNSVEIGFSPAVSRLRVQGNDLLNARLILEKGRDRAHRFILSQYDPTLEKYTGSNQLS